MPKPHPAVARTAFIVLMLILWEAFCRIVPTSPILIAPPSRILWEMVQIFAGSAVPDFYSNLWVTVHEIVIAYMIVACAGVALGFLFASSSVIGDAFEPLLLVLYAIPKIILYPVIVLILGIGILPKIVLGIMLGIFVVIFNTTAGLRQIEPSYVCLARSLGYGKWKIFFKVIAPAAAPTILAGLRLGFGYTIIGVITGELLVVNAGLGFLIDWASVNYYTPQLYALILVALALGIVGSCLFNILERRWVR